MSPGPKVEKFKTFKNVKDPFSSLNVKYKRNMNVKYNSIQRGGARRCRAVRGGARCEAMQGGARLCGAVRGCARLCEAKVCM